MTPGLKRATFWILLAASVATAAWWVFYVPYRPERLFCAIPANASVMSVHQNLAGEWNSLLHNPLWLEVLHAAGIPEDELAGVATNEVIRQWFTRLASDQSLLAYVPALGGQGKPALVAATWVGGQSRRLRWQMAWIKSRDFSRLSLDEGRLNVWLTRVKVGKTNLRLSLALSEGMVLGCLSEDPVGVRTLLEGAESYPHRLTLAMTGRPERARRLLAGSPRHWGWVNVRDDLVTFQTALDDNRLRLDVAGALALPPAPPLASAAGLKKVTDLLGSSSDLVTIVPLSWIHSLAGTDSSALWMNTLRPLFNTNAAPENALAFVALLDRDHSARLRSPFGPTLRSLIKGVKTPTLLLGMQVADPNEADLRIQRIVAQLNSQYNLNLSTRRLESGERKTMTLIQDGASTFYGKFEPDEQVAYTMIDDWLILASNASTLKKMRDTTGKDAPAWGAQEGSDQSAIAWINLEGTGKTVKNLANILKLTTLLTSSPQAAGTRATLERIETWSDALRVMNQANASASLSNGILRATVVLGKPN